MSRATLMLREMVIEGDERLAVVMLLWLPGSLRLGRSLGQPRGRQALGVALVLAVNVAAGLYPLPLLAAARL